jgi:hypothetical protein
MATKSTTKSESPVVEKLDPKEFVDLLTSGEDGMKKEEATDIVNRLIPAIDQLMPRSSVEDKRQIMLVKCRDIMRVGEVDKFKGLCIAVDDMKDSMGYQKYVAMAAYKENPQRALREGMVTKDGDKVIPMDTRQFLDPGRTKSNRNYGKPLPTIDRREGYFIIDGKIIRSFGQYDAQIGHVYELFGNMGEKDILNINKTPAPRLVETLGDADFWKQSYEICSNSDLAVPLEDLPNTDKGKTVIVMGTVQHVGKTGNQSSMIIINNDDIPDGIAGFAAFDGIGKEIDGLGKGAEAIVVGRVLKTKDRNNPGEFRTALNVMGIIQNPRTEGFGDILSKLDDVAFK